MAGRPRARRPLAVAMSLLAALCEGSADDGDYQCLLQVDSALGQALHDPPDAAERSWVAVKEDCSEVIKRRDEYSKQAFDNLRQEGRKSVERCMTSCDKHISLQVAAHESCEQKHLGLQDACRRTAEQLQADLARAVEAKGQLGKMQEQQERVASDQHQRIQELTQQLEKTTEEKNQLDKENMRLQERAQSLEDAATKIGELTPQLEKTNEEKNQLDKENMRLRERAQSLEDAVKKLGELTPQLEKTTEDKNQLDKENMRLRERAQSLEDAVKKIGELTQQLEQAKEETGQLEQENARLLERAPLVEGDALPGTIRRLTHQVQELEKQLGESRTEKALLYKDSGHLISAKQGAESTVERQAQQLEVGQRLREQLEKESLERKLAGQQLETTLAQCELNRKQVLAKCELDQKQMLAKCELLQKQMSHKISALAAEKNQCKSVAGEKTRELQAALKNVTRDEGRLEAALKEVEKERSARYAKWKVSLDEINALDDIAIEFATSEVMLKQVNTRLDWQLNVILGDGEGGSTEPAISHEAQKLSDMKAKLDRKFVSLQGSQAGTKPGGGGPFWPRYDWRKG